MIAPRKIIADGLAHTVRQEHTRVIPKHGVSDCRFHTHARCTSRNDEIFDSEAFEDVVQFGFEEAAESVLVHNSVLGLGLRFRDDVGVPRISNEYSTFRSVRSRKRLPHAEVQVPCPIWRPQIAQVRKIGSKSHFQVDNRDPALAG